MCRPVRLFLAALVACAASLSTLPAAAGAQSPASALKLVVTKSPTTAPGQRQVVTARIKNTAPSDWLPDLAGATWTTVVFDGTGPVPTTLQLRSNYGWACEYTNVLFDDNDNLRGKVFCQLRHSIAAGELSLPLEFEVRPLDAVSLSTQLGVGSFFYNGIFTDNLEQTAADGVTPETSPISLTWDPAAGNETAPGQMWRHRAQRPISPRRRPPSLHGAVGRRDLDRCVQCQRLPVHQPVVRPWVHV